MKKPDFYCQMFIKCHGNLPKYQPSDCKEQCHDCMDEVIDHHFNKKPKLSDKIIHISGDENMSPETINMINIAVEIAYEK